ncbi:MAG TPA: hypothetical protein VGK99_21395 [Acidobacteriota bacterium]|jgi:hypothetical protein
MPKPDGSYRADYIANGKCWRLTMRQENGFVSLTVQALEAGKESRITGRAETVEEGKRKLIAAAEAILGPARNEVKWEFQNTRARND